jgi:hypothetical protein
LFRSYIPRIRRWIISMIRYPMGSIVPWNSHGFLMFTASGRRRGCPDTYRNATVGRVGRHTPTGRPPAIRRRLTNCVDAACPPGWPPPAAGLDLASKLPATPLPPPLPPRRPRMAPGPPAALAHCWLTSLFRKLAVEGTDEIQTMITLVQKNCPALQSAGELPDRSAQRYKGSRRIDCDAICQPAIDENDPICICESRHHREECPVHRVSTISFRVSVPGQADDLD